MYMLVEVSFSGNVCTGKGTIGGFELEILFPQKLCTFQLLLMINLLCLCEATASSKEDRLEIQYSAPSL